MLLVLLLLDLLLLLKLQSVVLKLLFYCSSRGWPCWRLCFTDWPCCSCCSGCASCFVVLLLQALLELLPAA